jgi:hypothetical protein
MIFRVLTELQEKSRNAAHTSTIMHWVEMNGWNQQDQGRRWIAPRERLRPEMDDKRLTPSGDGSQHDMDRDQTWMDDRGG